MCILTSEMCILVYDGFVFFLFPMLVTTTMQQISALKHHLLVIFWGLGTARRHCICTSVYCRNSSSPFLDFSPLDTLAARVNRAL